jgi:hypothetical protein
VTPLDESEKISASCLRRLGMLLSLGMQILGSKSGLLWTQSCPKFVLNSLCSYFSVKGPNIRESKKWKDDERRMRHAWDSPTISP